MRLAPTPVKDAGKIMGLLDWFNKEQSEMDAVDHDARHLRQSYGLDVEQWVEIGLLGSVGQSKKTRRLHLLKRALRYH